MSSQHGVLDEGYHQRRLSRLSHRYRLQRRTSEVEKALGRHGQGELRWLVDVGTADGLMLDALKARLGAGVRFIGIDLSLALLKKHRGNGVSLIQAEAESLPIRSGSADAVVATAVIEHARDPGRMMAECARVLRPGGLLVLTAPSPAMERIATAVGLLDEDGAHNVMLGLEELGDLAEQSGLTVVEARKFMLSPIGLPAEETLERLLTFLRLGAVLANQLLVARR
jgi:SAM-dependent methyltransferase